MAKKGYTLLEILIVMAIIAVLIGIIFAVLGPARASARSSVCMSNMHQIGIGYSLYMSDYNGVELQQGVKITPAQAALPISSTLNIGFIDKYIGSRAVMHCPSYHDPDPLDQSYMLTSTYLIRFYDPPFDRENEIEIISNELALKGVNSWLAVCDQHNVAVGTDVANLHTWDMKWINVLRFNQQLSKIQTKAKNHSYYGL